MRRTITNLSRITNVSRQTIYKHIDKLKIVKPPPKTEYPEIDFEIIRRSVLKQPYDELLQSRNVSVKSQPTVNIEPKLEDLDANVGTTRYRLDNAKQEYQFNRKVITDLQEEIHEDQAKQGDLKAVNGNGAKSTLPQLATLEKYTKLNISLSKMISELEGDLDLQVDEVEEDPFG